MGKKTGKKMEEYLIIVRKRSLELTKEIEKKKKQIPAATDFNIKRQTCSATMNKK